MGGGDLNLKKSWHPSTLRNIERVWKAEQKHELEKQKIEQLQKELAEERAREEIIAYAEDQGVVKKKDERLDWMYQGPAAMVSRDEYLLGRKIDKTFEVLQRQEKGEEAPAEEDSRLNSMFSNATGNATVDLANKIREDPLFTIMKKEKEQRKSLLTNPVKMKQLQEILKMSLTSEKKSKKEKNKRKCHARSPEDEDRKHKKKSKKCKSTSESSESESDERKLVYQKRKDYDNKPSSKQGLYDDSERNHKRRSEREMNSRKDFYCRKENYMNQKVNYKNHHHDNRHKYREENYKKSTHSNSTSYRQEQRNDSKKESKKKMSAEERERLLMEMEENARWREDQRHRNTKRYKEEADREDNFQRGDSGSFIRPMLSKAVGKESLENRVKQKVFTIQRKQSDMESHFARR